jgi:multidrug efflux pump subunit AcrA (membrane-fusion protein)
MIMPTTALLLVLSAIVGGSAPEGAGDRIEIPSALIKLVKQVDVPAREAGVLAAVNVVEGQMVEEGELLAQIVDTEARIAEATAKSDLEIARRNSENDVNTRFAKKSVEVAKAELARSTESIEQYAKSISDSEMDRLRLLVERVGLEVEQAEREFEIAGYTRQIKESAYEAAREKVERHRITAPLSGVVVQVNRHQGEWVEPGEMVMRILRLDRLRAEGFLDVRYLRHDLREWQVKLTVDLPGAAGAEFPGKVVFLSPEIDPVNSQISIWVEIENKDLRLRPGMRAKMTIVVPPPKP